jgi:hypothetical protein
MKALITLVALSFSFQSFAYEASVMSSVSSYLTSASLGAQNRLLKAEEILKDTNAYNLNGDMSPALAEHIRNIQDQTSELSEAEAIDLLVEQAQTILEKN